MQELVLNMQKNPIKI
uniref:Uncharacterized protein n=1 Tax=Arundo donax TaxID=35708 RepID=A0A0A9EQS4_ARUDO